MSMLQHCAKDQPSPQLPTSSDGGAFILDWPSTSQVMSITSLTVDRLPSLSYSLYLTDTVKFYLGPMYHLYDEDIFRKELRNFYATGPWVEPLWSNRLWFIQYLLLMALGKALIVPGSSDKRPTGYDYVLRAIELLPDVHGYYVDSILSVEILCCLSLYLQSIDHRNTAYNYVGDILPPWSRVHLTSTPDWPGSSNCPVSRLSPRIDWHIAHGKGSSQTSACVVDALYSR
jgi:hypothetical protein